MMGGVVSPASDADEVGDALLARSRSSGEGGSRPGRDFCSCRMEEAAAGGADVSELAALEAKVELQRQAERSGRTAFGNRAGRRKGMPSRRGG